MKLFRFENLVFEVSNSIGQTQVFTVTHLNNKFFGMEFTRYSATSYQLTNEFVPLSDSLINCKPESLPLFDNTLDKWTDEFISFICSTMTHIGLFDHLVNCPFVSVWNDDFEIFTTCTYNIMTGEVTNIELSNVITDSNGKNLSTLKHQYIIYDGFDSQRDEFPLVETPDGRIFADSRIFSLKKVL